MSLKSKLFGIYQFPESSVHGKTLEKFRESYVHIPDLKPGDKVKWKDKFKNKEWPDYETVIEVFSVFPIITNQNNVTCSGSNHFLAESDFSAVCMKDSDTLFAEYAFDSRCFEKVN